MLSSPLQRQREEYTPPRTVLSFYAWVLGLLEAGVVALTAVLASNDDLHDIIPFVLVFGAVVLVVLITVVVRMNTRHPEKLQLEQVSAREYIQYQQVLRGDSIAGDYLQPDPMAPPRLIQPTADPDSDAEGAKDESADDDDDGAVREGSSGG